ncbi:MAG: class I SAM-dependent methyltransferase [Spirochaetota bacterium]
MADSLSSWNTHYTRAKSALNYPDENLVRMLRPWLEGRSAEQLAALDLGCGSGRHLKLLSECGVGNITGSDYSQQALDIAKAFGLPLVLADNTALPFENDSFDIVVCWGALHYSSKESFTRQVSEIRRVLKPGGALFATLRSEFDTMMRKGTHIGNNVWVTSLSDITQSVASFYSQQELADGFSAFSHLDYGIMERTVPGKMNERISHWYFRADR